MAQGLCLSPACSFKHPFPRLLLSQLPHPRLESVPISPSCCRSQALTCPHDTSCPALHLQHLSPSTAPLSLLIYDAIIYFLPTYHLSQCSLKKGRDL